MIYDRQWQMVGLAASFWCITVGIAMMTLWLVEPVDIAEQFPSLFGMKFNAALAFALMGVALIMTMHGLRIVPVLMMAVVVLYGTLSLFQHLLGIDAGIDRLLHQPFVQIGTSLPGRIAPNTALCFMLIGSAIALRALKGRNDLGQASLAFAGFIIAATSLIGYAISLDVAHDWIAYTRMSIQSATCFTAMATAVLFIGGREAGYHRLTLAAGLGVITYLILLILTYAEMRLHEQRLGAIFENSARAVESTLSSLVLISGTLYAALIAYSLHSSRRSRRMAEDLAESRAQLAAIIGNAVDGIITIDERGFILSTNAACERIFGYKGSEMMGRNIKMLMPEPYHSAHDGYLSNYRLTGEAKIIGAGREAEGRRKNGSIFPLDLAVARVETSGGTIYSGIVRDISERKRYERELLDANAELEEFAYRTSHDLRSPIASSIGLLNISRDMLREGDQAALDGTLVRMEKNFRRLDHLIQNIIVLTRNRLMEEENQPIRVQDVVAETLETLSHLEDFPRIRIENHVDQELTIVNKLSRFQIIVGNMISNAIKYHDRQEAEPRIDIHAMRRAGRVRLSVEDNGIGIPPESRAHLFRMFKRLHPNRSFGSGLGLYILKRSAESLGGTAFYEPKEKGSRFVIELPDGDGHEYRSDPGRR